MSTTEFYNNHAKHFQQTRQKPRPEFILLNEILTKYKSQEYNNQDNILDIWCGSGRLAAIIDQLYEKNNKQKPIYTGIDNSEELILLARKTYPTKYYDIYDMTTYLEKEPDRSYDIIISWASFQHITTIKQREKTLFHIHRALKVWWIHITINRSRSYWMIQKHYKALLHSVKERFISWWYHTFSDLQIPRTQKDHTTYRYYHIFWLQELYLLHKRNNFTIINSWYTSKTWTIIKDRRYARNTLIVGQKIKA